MLPEEPKAVAVIGSTLGVGAMGPHQAREKTMEHRRPEGVA
jgi:hypothetical protein